MSAPGAALKTKEASSPWATAKSGDITSHALARVANAGGKLSANGEVSHDSGRAQGAMADLHLSGSDPRLFPGIFTRDHRSGGLRNSNQTDEWVVDSSEAPGDDEDEL